MTSDMEFFVICCDGIWDVMTNQEVADFITSRIINKVALQDIAEQLLMHCLSEDMTATSLGCDNMTAVIVANLEGRTYEQFCEDIGSQEGVTANLKRVMTGSAP